MSGLGIRDPIEASGHVFNTCVKAKKMLFDAIISSCTVRTMCRSIDNKCSTWPSLIPTMDNHITASPDKIKDAFAIRYSLPSEKPRHVQCGEQLNMTHALNCKKVVLSQLYTMKLGILTMTFVINLAGLHQIISKPVLQEAFNDQPGLSSYWKVR